MNNFGFLFSQKETTLERPIRNSIDNTPTRLPPSDNEPKVLRLSMPPMLRASLPPPWSPPLSPPASAAPEQMQHERSNTIQEHRANGPTTCSTNPSSSPVPYRSVTVTAPSQSQSTRNLSSESADTQTAQQSTTNSSSPRWDALPLKDDSGDEDDPRTNRLSDTPLMSELTRKFIGEVNVLNASRKLFCSDEYPMSFTGLEAVRILQDLLPADLPESTYRMIARAFMRTQPPFIQPVAYSRKSSKSNILYNSSKEIYTLVQDALEQGPATGVLTPLTECYSYACRKGERDCYALTCPHKDTSLQRTKKPSDSKSAMTVKSTSVVSSHDTAVSRAWQARVPPEVLQRLPEREIKRQEAIHEVIYTEEEYWHGLQLLDEVFAKELRTAQCIEMDRRNSFCDQVFGNYEEILSLHTKLYADLRDRQIESQAKTVEGSIDQIGDIILRHLSGFMHPYSIYGPNVALAKYVSNREMSRNMLYSNFIREKERRAECRRLSFSSFLLQPVTRIQRFSLLLDAVLKYTPDQHPDKAQLEECIQLIKNVAITMDNAMVYARKTLRIWEINDSIRYKNNENYDLYLLDPERELLLEGEFRRRVHINEWVNIHVFLFDHLLLMTKPKTVNDKVEYVISKRPIALELLHVSDTVDGSRTPSSTFTSTANSISSRPAGNNGSYRALMIFRHFGRYGGEHPLYAEDEKQRAEWKQMIAKAKMKLEKAHPERNIFQLRTLSDTTFALTTGVASNGKVTCSAVFVGSRGIPMVAIGTDMGVWVGIDGDSHNLERMLHLDGVSQIDILEEQHIFLVLADKTLFAYPLDSLDPTSLNPPKEPVCHRIAGNVSLFNTGVYNHRTLVVIMKKRSITSLFKAYEPVCGDLRSPKSAKYLSGKSGFLRHAPSWFKLYKEFYVGATGTSIQFLRTRIAIVCERGFEIIDLSRLHENHNLPDLSHPVFDFITRYNDEARPLGMFRIHDTYLLCYNMFAFTVDMRGMLVRQYPKFYWEGTPHSVAFSYPFVIAFDSQFIEARHVETGELVQIIAGENMNSLLYKPSTNSSPVIHGCMAHPFKPEFQYIFHLVSNYNPTDW